MHKTWYLRDVKKEVRKPKRDWVLAEKDHEYRVHVANRFEALRSMPDESAPDVIWNGFKDVATTLVDKAPRKRKVANKPWISAGTLQLISERRLSKSRDAVLYRSLASRVKSACRKDKKEYILSMCEVINGYHIRGKSADAFREIKRLCGEFKPQMNSIRDKDGHILTEDKDVIAIWQEYCQDMFATNSTAGSVRNTHNADSTQIHDDSELTPLRSEITQAINCLKDGKSAGSDEIPAELLKLAGEPAIDVIHKLCVAVWKTGMWPDDWRRAVFITIPKKGDMKVCSNYRTISLISHTSKVLLKILMRRIQKHVDQELNIVQAGFRGNRGTRDHIFNLMNIRQKCREYQQPLYMCFVDYSKAFDTVCHSKLWETLKEMGFPGRAIELMESLYESQQSAVRCGSGTSDWFSIQKGVRQGCVMSPTLFSMYTEAIMRLVQQELDDTEFADYVRIGGENITELRYADDTVLMATSRTGLRKIIELVNKHSIDFALAINVSKTKIMVEDSLDSGDPILLNGKPIQEVVNFCYLGAAIAVEQSSEIRSRLAQASNKLTKLKPFWASESKNTKLMVLRACVFPVALYGCEAWTLRQADREHINAFEMRCYRRVLKIPWTHHRTNESVLDEINVKPEWLMRSVWKQQLNFFGHVKRHDGLEKRLMEGCVPGHRRRGRQRMRWGPACLVETFGGATNAGVMARERMTWRRFVCDATLANS